jgi:hypothetical protein
VKAHELTHEERVAEKIAILLLSLSSEEAIESASQDALNMALRGNRGWWEIGGKPYFNERMARLRAKLENRK